MFPSSGLFKNTICPHYKDSTVNCQRPYCHFLHTKNDNSIEHLNDSFIKEALLSKQYNNVLQQIENGGLQEKVPVYIPTKISNDIKESDKTKEKCSPKLLHYIPSLCNNSEDKDKIVDYTPTPRKKLHTHENTYEPSISNQENNVINKNVIDYKPSCSTSIKKNENTYEPLNTHLLDNSTENNETVTYNPSIPAKKPKFDNYFDNPNVELSLSDNTLYEDECKPGSSKKHNGSKNNLIIDSEKLKDEDKQHSKSTNNEKDDKSRNRVSKSSSKSKSSLHSKNTSHHHKSSHKSKISKTKHCDTKHLHQSKSKHDSKSTRSSKDDNDKLKIKEDSNTSNKIKKIDHEQTTQNLSENSLSDENQLSNKNPKLSIDFDNLQVEFDLIDDILNENDCKHASTKRHEENNSEKFKNKDKLSSRLKDNDRDDKSKQKSSRTSSTTNHHHKSSHSSSKSKSENSSSSKDSSKLNKNCDKKSSHQSKSKQDSKHKTYTKTSHEDKLKIKEDSSVNTKTKKNIVHNLFESDEELDHPVCTTDLTDPIVLECLKISEEYNSNVDVFKEHIQEKQQKAPTFEIPETSTTKKRIAHPSANTVSRSSFKHGKKFNPANTFVERYKKILENQKQREFEECQRKIDELINSTKPVSKVKNENCSISQLKSSFASPLNNRPTLSKPIPVRIAHTPKIPTTSSSVGMQTLKKGSVRTAHVPNENILKKLDATNLLDSNNSKIPSNVRLAYLNYITEACLEMHKNDVDKAHKMAQEEELSVAKKCMNIKVYKNSCLLTILKIRKATKGGDNSANNNYQKDTVKRLLPAQNQYDKLSKTQKYEMIKRWVLTDEDLEINSYPLPTLTCGVARIANDKLKLISEDKKIRQCARCPKEYSVDDNGIPLVRDACIYHPKRSYRIRGQSTYGCCGLELGSIGCCSGDHVIDGILGPDDGLRTGFVQTLKKPAGHPANDSIYALDCEMVYTTKGIELARITVVNDRLDIEYDTFVKPENYILDYATAFSGITAEMLKDVTTTIFQVQAVLLNMFSDTTILIGHSLESDLKALKIVHKFVVDTSILFPHKAGLPYKRALKTLAIEHLQKIIQESTGGHDSAEDARITMELVIWKAKEFLKVQ